MHIIREQSIDLVDFSVEIREEMLSPFEVISQENFRSVSNLKYSHPSDGRTKHSETVTGETMQHQYFSPFPFPSGGSCPSIGRVPK